MKQRRKYPLAQKQVEYRDRMKMPIVGMKIRRGPVGCYECCQGRGSRSELWEKLCPVCHKLTRAFECCGYQTIRVNPRIRVPRLGSNRWKGFLRKFPQFTTLTVAVKPEPPLCLGCQADADLDKDGYCADCNNEDEEVQ